MNRTEIRRVIRSGIFISGVFIFCLVSALLSDGLAQGFGRPVPISAKSENRANLIRRITVQLGTLPSMLLSSPLLNNTFWRIGLVSCLLVYLTKAQEFRQQELLHGQLRDGKVEYILLPRCTVPIKSIKASMDLGLTETVKVFPDSVKSLDRKCKKKADLHAGIYALHNARADNNESVGMTRIFRLEKGETSEYLADINGRGQCFGLIWKWVSANSIGSGGYMEAPENIREELEELCNDGFLALEPSSDTAGLDGTYVGNGLRKSLALEFDQGTLMKANLRVSEVNDDFRMAMFYPLCDGIISVIPQIGLPTENEPTYLILKKSVEEKREHGRFLREKMRAAQKKMLPRRKVPKEEFELLSPVGEDYSQSLCNDHHVRRTIGRYELEKWDRDLPESFILKPKATTG